MDTIQHGTGKRVSVLVSEEELPFFSFDELSHVPHEDFLTAIERQHYDICQDSKKNDWLLGRYAVKCELIRYLARRYGIALDALDIEIVSTLFAPPRFRIVGSEKTSSRLKRSLESNLCISIAHSKGFATAGVADLEKEGSIGVDVERMRAFSEETVRAFLTEREYQWLLTQRAENRDSCTTLMWCLKEAYLKAKGVGLCMHPQRIELCLSGNATLFSEDGRPIKTRSAWTFKNKQCILARVKIPGV